MQHSLNPCQLVESGTIACNQPQSQSSAATEKKVPNRLYRFTLFGVSSGAGFRFRPTESLDVKL